MESKVSKHDTKIDSVLYLINWCELEIVIKHKLECGEWQHDFSHLLKYYVYKLIENEDLNFNIKPQPLVSAYLYNFQKICHLDFQNFADLMNEKQLRNIIITEIKKQLSFFNFVLESQDYDAFVRTLPFYGNEEAQLEQALGYLNSFLGRAGFFKMGFINSILRKMNLFFLFFLIPAVNKFVQCKISPSEGPKNSLVNYLNKRIRLGILPFVKGHLKNTFLSKLSYFVYLFLSLYTSDNTFFGNLARKKRHLFSIYVYIYGRILFTIGKYAEAFNFFSLAFNWNFKEDILWRIGLTAERINDYYTAYIVYSAYLFFYKKVDPTLILNLGHVFLLLDRKDDAIPFLVRARREWPSFSMAHQNMAAQYNQDNYHLQSLDLILKPEVILYDAYNIIGERGVQLGCGDEGVIFYGKAIEIQKRAPRILQDTVLKLKLANEYNIDPNLPIRILPYEWVTLIGHIAMLDSYLKLKYLKIAHGDTQTILLAPKNKVSNQSYLDLWRPHVTVIEDPLMVNALFPYQRYYGDCFNGYINNNGIPRDWTELGAIGQLEWDKRNLDPLIKLSPIIEEKGKQELINMGLKPEDWFVALHIRGSGYHREDKNSIQTHRVAGIYDYLEAIKEITKKGGWVIRMGDSSMPKLPIMKRVIDYAHSKNKSQWMDIYLAAKAKFFIGTTSGLSNVVISLGTPCLLVNCISNYFQLWNNKVLFTFKKLWDENNQRYLSLSEMVADPFRWTIFNIHQLNGKGIFPHNNTADEIRGATIEMIDRLTNNRLSIATEADLFLKEECDRSGNSHYFGNGRLSESYYQRSQNVFKTKAKETKKTRANYEVVY